MSEYQYYEFLAIDRPLTKEDQSALRAISTRAQITSTSFTNYYEYGDLKGDPIEFMKQWFDIHVYLANWGSPRLMIRLPKKLVDRAQLGGMLGDSDYANVYETEGHVILDLMRPEVESNRDFDDGSGWMDDLTPLRNDLLAGDLRLLYLFWLIDVEDGLFEEDEEGVEEPLDGLGPLTPQLKAAAEFFFLDEDLVAAAAERDGGVKTGAGLSAGEIRRLIEALPESEKVDLLCRLV